MDATATSAYEWKDLPWKRFERHVFKLQQRIYRASSRGDTKTVHRLERLLIRSRAARYLAVRRVTQDNRGKKTAGVDGVADLTPPQRHDLAATLRLSQKAQPVRRVWIPKPGKAEQRPLGIPTMRERAAQTLVRLALEPEWEARFEPNSYGFRPGRSVHDAREAIFNAICGKPRYVLDADIAACFDRIDHVALLRKLCTFPALRRVIRGWLKAGVWDGVDIKPTDAGTPQGGALSPLLANVALHGLEAHLRAAFPVTKTTASGMRSLWKPIVIRYADDFVVLHEDRAAIEQARHLAAQWLAGIGLELKPEKTRISHTLYPHEGRVGFDFLGFEVRQHRVGYHRSGKARHGFKTLIKPSRNAQARHQRDLREIVRAHQGAPQKALINRLNPVVRGWAHFYSRSVSSEVFSHMDHLLWVKLWRWSRRRHPAKSLRWVKQRYWSSEEERTWVFGRRGEAVLNKHAETKIGRHELVRGNASPYDGDWLYWARRLGRHPELPQQTARLLKRQAGRCAWCGLFFVSTDELIENDHILPRAFGGGNGDRNRQLLHGHCHDAKTAIDGSNRRRTNGGTNDRDHVSRSRVRGNSHARF